MNLYMIIIYAEKDIKDIIANDCARDSLRHEVGEKRKKFNGSKAS
jgi:hypothetical protein